MLTASGASTYTWSPSTGLNTTSGATVTASPIVTTTYTVVGTSASGCQNSNTVTVTVNRPLPVQLTSFTARWSGSKAILNWATASELNSDYFAVERSGNGTDFSTLTQVASAGTSSKPNTYSFTDTNPLKDATYYRLRQVDRDGTTAYSPIALLTTSQGSAGWLVATDSPQRFNIRATLDAASRFTVLDVMGRSVFTQAVTPDHAEVVIPNLPTGVYFFRLLTQQGRFTVQQAVMGGN